MREAHCRLATFACGEQNARIHQGTCQLGRGLVVGGVSQQHRLQVVPGVTRTDAPFLRRHRQLTKETGQPRPLGVPERLKRYLGFLVNRAFEATERAIARKRQPDLMVRRLSRLE